MDFIEYKLLLKGVLLILTPLTPFLARQCSAATGLSAGSFRLCCSILEIKVYMEGIGLLKNLEDTQNVTAIK